MEAPKFYRLMSTLRGILRYGVKLPVVDPGSSREFPAKVFTNRNPNGEGTIHTEVTVGRKLWLWNVRHLLTETIKKIPISGWTIVRAPNSISWPTTDNPVVKLRYMTANNYNYDGSWGVPKCDVFLPLGPKHLLHNFVGQRSWPRGTTLDVATAQQIRRIIIGHAHRYVFDKEQSDAPLILPRMVNQAQYQEEQTIWQNWHRAQSDAEVDGS